MELTDRHLPRRIQTSLRSRSSRFARSRLNTRSTSLRLCPSSTPARGRPCSNARIRSVAWGSGVVERADADILWIQLDELAAAVLSSMSSAQKSEVKAWEEEIVACTHTIDLVQPEAKKLEPSGQSFPSFRIVACVALMQICRTRGVRSPGLRLDLQPLALPHLRLVGVRTPAVRWRWRKWAWSGAHADVRPLRRC